MENARQPPTPATGPRRVLYLTAGFLFVGLAYLGAVLPGLPATPWVLLASYCFARSSPRLERWLTQSRIFGPLLRDWHEHRGLRWRVKLVSVGLIVTVVTLSLVFGGLPLWLRWVIGGCAACGVIVVLFVVPTVKVESVSTSTCP